MTSTAFTSSKPASTVQRNRASAVATPASAPERLRCQTFAEILAEEQTVIACRRGRDKKAFNRVDLKDLYHAINQDNRTALCLSGGGIRSAAFSLGAVQRFSSVPIRTRDNGTRPLLSEFDYLSTVSGGGYTGSWLSAWLYRVRADTMPDPVLAAVDGRDRNGREPDPIHNLRKNANYLAPRSRTFSPDVWNDIACVVRNLLLNWLVILPAIGLVILLVQILIAGFSLGAEAVSPLVPLAVGIALASLSVGYTALHIPTRMMRKAQRTPFLVIDLVFWLAASVCLLRAWLDWRTAHQAIFSWSPGAAFLIGTSAIVGSVWFAAIWRLCIPLDRWLDNIRKNGSAIRSALSRPQETADTISAPASMEGGNEFAWWGPFGWALAGALFGTVLAILAIAANGLLDRYNGFGGAILLLAVGVPLIVTARLTAEVLFTAMSVRVNNSDMNFEWLSRSGGYFGLWALGWGAVAALVGFGPRVFAILGESVPSSLLFGLLGSTGVGGVFAAFFGKSSHSGPLPDVAAAARKYLTLDQLAQLGALLFGIGLVLGFAILFDRFLFGGLFAADIFAGELNQFLRPVVAAVVLAGVSGVASCFVNVNRFSLHGLYRDRLMRTFLGASRSDSQRNNTRDTFSDYDGNDNLCMRHLWLPLPKDKPTHFDDRHLQHAPVSDWLPLHVVNVTVNLASSKNLAWQERKAMPFTISPLHAGSCSLDVRNDSRHMTDRPDGAFLSTRYRGEAQRSYGGTYGLTLATAMAISGAAISPNMGYYTSPGISFLMTLFNMRLGWWLANPAKPKAPYWKTGPGFSLWPLLREMFGLTNEHARWLLLSDGGHFDNTGLYEMIRRRCRTIVMIDGGQDPHFRFVDLGRTLMKISVDFGIRIEFEGLDHLQARVTNWPSQIKPSPYWAVARIRYRDRDGPESIDGCLLYLKAGLHGTEPIDILSYGLTHTQFPNDTTLNQFYQESQFESYRALGYEIANQALIAGGAVKAGSTRPTDEAASMTLEEIIKAIAQAHPCKEKKAQKPAGAGQ